MPANYFSLYCFTVLPFYRLTMECTRVHNVIGPNRRTTKYFDDDDDDDDNDDDDDDDDMRTCHVSWSARVKRSKAKKMC